MREVLGVEFAKLDSRVVQSEVLTSLMEIFFRLCRFSWGVSLAGEFYFCAVVTLFGFV